MNKASVVVGGAAVGSGLAGKRGSAPGLLHGFSGALAGAGLILCLAAPAAAQQARPAERMAPAIEEVVVTARKREETLQDTPVSITAFPAETLEETNMVDLRDIGKFTPGMSFTSYGMGSAEAGAIFLRGIGQSDHLVTTDPGVGLYIDGVYVGRNQGAALDLLELQQVEVLRGPQGTLYGKNTIGGAVNVTSRKPSGEAVRRLGLTVGEEGRLNINAYLEAPLGDSAAFSIAALSKARDGVGTQVLNGGDDLGDEDSFGFRGAFYWQSAKSEFNLTVDSFDADQGAVPHSLYLDTDPEDIKDGLTRCIGLFGGGLATCSDDYPDAASQGRDPYDSYTTDNMDTEQELFGVAATWEREISDRLSFKSITASREMSYLGNLEFDGGPLRIIWYNEEGESEQFSQEFQLSGAGEVLNWIAGLYYFTEDGHNDQRDHEFGGVNNRYIEVETTSFALFGQGTADFGDRFSLTLGLRYTDEEKDYSVFRRATEADGKTPTTEPATYSIVPTELSDSWDAISGTASFSVDLSDSALGYVTASRGFRSGGFNARPGQQASVGIYDPEYVTMLELGLKTQALNDRLRFNLALYQSDYEDYQAQVNNLDGMFDTRTINAAEAEIQGYELELAFVQGVFRLDMTYANTDATIESIDLTHPTLRLGANFEEGDKLPYVSEITYSISPQLNFTLGNGASMLLRADYTYRDDFFGQISNHPGEEEEGYGLLNLRFQYKTAGEGLTVALYGINVTDERYTRVRNYFANFIGFALWNTDTREFGIALNAEF